MIREQTEGDGLRKATARRLAIEERDRQVHDSGKQCSRCAYYDPLHDGSGRYGEPAGWCTFTTVEKLPFWMEQNRSMIDSVGADVSATDGSDCDRFEAGDNRQRGEPRVETATHLYETTESGKVVRVELPDPNRGKCAPFMRFAEDHGLDYATVLLASDAMRKRRDEDMNPHERAAYDQLLTSNTKTFDFLADLTMEWDHRYGRPVPPIVRF